MIRLTPRPNALILLAAVMAVLSAASVRGQDAALAAADQQRFADGLYSRGLHDMALAEYRKFLKDHPNDPNRAMVLYRAGESARKLNFAAEAQEFFQQAVEAGGEAGDVAVQRARLRLADLHLRAERFAQARTHAEALLAKKPEAELAASALYILGQAAYRLGDAAAGRKAFDDLVKTHPDDIFATYAALALARQEVKDPVARRAWYRLALRQPPSADLEVEALWGLATVELEQGQVAAAAEQFKRLWQRHPNSARVRGGLLHIAWSLMQAGRYAEALEVAADTSDTRKKEQADTWLYLEGLCLRMTGGEGKSIERYQALLRDHPESRLRASGAYDLAVLHSQRGEYAAVLPLATDVLALVERREDALWLLAESARALGRADEAQGYYQRMVRDFPKGARLADARYNRAVLMQAGQALEAAEAFALFATQHPADPRAATALLTAGSLWVAAEKGNEAATAWERLLAQYPRDPRVAEVRMQSALLRMRGGKSAEAIGHFQAYLAIEPAPARIGEARYWLGMLFEDSGDMAGAEASFRAALSQGIAPEQAVKARFRLGLILQRAQRNAEAVEVWLPLLADAASARQMPDSLLVWMLQELRANGKTEGIPTVARAMTDAARPPLTRELGFYALARASRHTPEILKAWQDGLALGSESEDAAEASLALGRLHLQRKEFPAAETRLAFAAQLASKLDRGDLQARALQAMGDTQALRGQWAEAARLYMGVAVLWDDPIVTPQCLHAAAEAFARAGQADSAAGARKELLARYPDFRPEVSPDAPQP